MQSATRKNELKKGKNKKAAEDRVQEEQDTYEYTDRAPHRDGDVSDHK